MEEQHSGDIHATLTLSYSEALNGATRTLTLPGGRQVTVSIPAGVRDGQEIRLAGQGATHSGGGPAGALVLTVVVAAADYLSDPSFSPPGTDYPTDLIAPPPPPPASSFPGYPSIGSGGAFTHYASQTMGEDSHPSPPALLQPSRYSGPRQHRGFPASLTLLLIILALLLIVGGGLIYAIAALRSTPSTAGAQATATAVAQAHVPGTATAVALQNIYTQATGGAPALDDPLSQQDSHNWDISATCAFAGGTYHASSSKTDNFFTCSSNAQPSDFGDFTFQVQMAIIRGDYGGMFFRANSTGTDYYTFTVDQSGHYSFDVYQNNSYLKTASSASSPAFKTGLNQANLITVVARGSIFYVYANGQFVTQVSDTSYNAGQIGLLAGDNTHSTEVAFSNLKVWSL